MNKLTKIIATIGPSSESSEMIEELILSGVDVFRFNFKHNSVDWHNERIIAVNKVAKKLGKSIGTLLDLQGPELRINMSVEEMNVIESQTISLSISHPQIISSLKKGQKIVADDGAFIFYVEKTIGEEIILTSHSSGILKNRKSFRIPGADLPFSSLIDRDFDGLKLAQKNEIDYIALSYVRNSHDIKILKEEMDKYKLNAKIIAKIETLQAIENIDKIIDVSDGVMVARGDLGIELPIEEVPYYQKIIIKKAMEKGIPVITATQMLQSMIDAPYPTRAEVSDVANATYDLTDAVMLSGESASGKYPLDAVKMMAKTLFSNEMRFSSDTREKISFKMDDPGGLICEAAYNLFLSLKKEQIGGFIIFTQTGRTATLVSRYRPTVPIYALTQNKKTADSLSLGFGIRPIVYHDTMSEKLDIKDVDKAVEYINKKENKASSKYYICLFGDSWLTGGTTSLRLVKKE